MTDATDKTPPVPPVQEGPNLQPLSVHDGSNGDIGLFDDLSQKSEKLLRYPNSPIPGADIGPGAEAIAQTPENEGVYQPGLRAEPPPSALEIPQAIAPQPALPETVGEAIPLVEPVRGRRPAPSPYGPLLIFFLISFSICSAGLNVYLFWQARNLAAELEKRPPAPKLPAWQKR